MKIERREFLNSAMAAAVGHMASGFRPNGADVDYMLISHFHRDHMGTVQWCKDVVRRGNRDYHLSGFSLAAGSLNFRTAIDRTGGAFDSRDSRRKAILRKEA